MSGTLSLTLYLSLTLTQLDHCSGSNKGCMVFATDEFTDCVQMLSSCNTITIAMMLVPSLLH